MNTCSCSDRRFERAYCEHSTVLKNVIEWNWDQSLIKFVWLLHCLNACDNLTISVHIYNSVLCVCYLKV